MEHATTTTGRTKFWHHRPIPKKASWVPKEPILKTEAPAPKPVPQVEPKERDRQICVQRANGQKISSLSREFGLHRETIRRILNRHMLPEEILKDEEQSNRTHRKWVRAEAEKAAALRRSGLKVSEVAKALGRALSTTTDMLKSVIPPEELKARAAYGKGHCRGKYGAPTTPAALRRLTYRKAVAAGERQVDPRPYRRVVSVARVSIGQRKGYNLFTLDCGHVLTIVASRGVQNRKRCTQCPAG